jgi:muconolactone delta-isomerase
METYMVVCTFATGTDMNEVMSVVAEEQAKVQELKDLGHIGALYLATRDRGTVFLEIFAADIESARIVVMSLPMSRWWDVDIYPLNEPVSREAAASKA